MNLQMRVHRTTVAIAIVLATILGLSGVFWGTPLAIADQTNNQLYVYSVTLEDRNGKVYISASTDGSIGNYDWVALYNHQPQEVGQPRGFDPNYLDSFNVSQVSSQQMNTQWQSGLYAIYSSYDNRKGKYVTLAQAGPTVALPPQACTRRN